MEPTATESAARQLDAVCDRSPRPLLQDPQSSTITTVTMATRGRASGVGTETADVLALNALALKFPPKSGNDAIAVNKPCYLMHPDMGDEAVAEGRTGGSWRAKA